MALDMLRGIVPHTLQLLNSNIKKKKKLSHISFHYNMPALVNVVRLENVSQRIKKINERDLTNSLRLPPFLIYQYLIKPSFSREHRRHQLLTGLKSLNDNPTCPLALVLYLLTKFCERRTQNELTVLIFKESVDPVPESTKYSKLQL